jgi:auxin efflux carrier family protein
MVRWSYGYRYLLAPEDDYKSDEESHTDSSDTPRLVRHLTMDADENTPLIYEIYDDHPRPNHKHYNHQPVHNGPLNSSHSRATSHSDLSSDYEYSTGGTSPVISSTTLLSDHTNALANENENTEDMISFPPPHVHRTRRPRPLFKRLRRFTIIAWREFLDFMNMPLWAMLVAIAVALFPHLQHYLFFKENGFVRGSVIYAIKTLGDVSIPLILVILGANIANDEKPSVEEEVSQNVEPVAGVAGERRERVLTQRQRALILGVASRMLIVPVCPLSIAGIKLHFVPLSST